MRQLLISVLGASLLGFWVTAMAAAPMQTVIADTSATIAPLVTRGPGPVVNPEGSQYMEEKKASGGKIITQNIKQDKHHDKKKHRGKNYHKKK